MDVLRAVAIAQKYRGRRFSLPEAPPVI